MFEGVNKNLIVFDQKGLKNQQFGFSNSTNTWFNFHTKRALMLQDHDHSKLLGGSNVLTNKLNAHNLEHSKWKVIPCNFKPMSDAEKEIADKKKNEDHDQHDEGGDKAEEEDDSADTDDSTKDPEQVEAEEKEA